MTEKRDRTPESAQRAPRTEPGEAGRRLDRRRFFQGLGLLTVGGLSATAGLAQTVPAGDSVDCPESADAPGSLGG